MQTHTNAADGIALVVLKEMPETANTPESVRFPERRVYTRALVVVMITGMIHSLKRGDSLNSLKRGQVRRIREALEID
jgi:hypothetical protein